MDSPSPCRPSTSGGGITNNTAVSSPPVSEICAVSPPLATMNQTPNRPPTVSRQRWTVGPARDNKIYCFTMKVSGKGKNRARPSGSHQTFFGSALRCQDVTPDELEAQIRGTNARNRFTSPVLVRKNN